MLACAGADLVFAPALEEMYSVRHGTSVIVDGIGDILEGECRPHFFRGVATVVIKLLIQSMPDIAVFGEKDYQQLLVIKKLVRNLSLPISIKSIPVIRENDGLAFSSRNSYLTKNQRILAPNFYKTIYAISRKISQGAAIGRILNEKKKYLLKIGFSKIDYLEVCSSTNLAKLSVFTKPARVFGALYLGRTRLIDNCRIK